MRRTLTISFSILASVGLLEDLPPGHQFPILPICGLLRQYDWMAVGRVGNNDSRHTHRQGRVMPKGHGALMRRGLSRAPKEHKLLFLSLPYDPSARRLRGSGRTTYRELAIRELYDDSEVKEVQVRKFKESSTVQ